MPCHACPVVQPVWSLSRPCCLLCSSVWLRIVIGGSSVLHPSLIVILPVDDTLVRVPAQGVLKFATPALRSSETCQPNALNGAADDKDNPQDGSGRRAALQKSLARLTTTAHRPPPTGTRPPSALGPKENPDAPIYDFCTHWTYPFVRSCDAPRQPSSSWQ